MQITITEDLLFVPTLKDLSVTTANALAVQSPALLGGFYFT